ncbi:single-strand binding family protein [Gemella haemolysans]|uniref:Single-stranded DNA-binding protein n=2 Tax=Gemella haemolysans TaxID=1379 RepID=A0A133ZS34_9BACL|nr:single-strand binding family protein [Gemella haemolysans]
MLYFAVAVNRIFTDQNGQRQTDFINCVAFRKQAENMARFLGRGSQVAVEGRIQTRNYQGKDGNTVYVTEVVAESVQFLESKNSSHSRQNNGFDSMSFNTNSSIGEVTFQDFEKDFKIDFEDDFIQQVVNPFKEN